MRFTGIAGPAGSGSKALPAGAAMGFIGIFSYLSASMQDIVSGILIDNGKTVATIGADGKEIFIYNFDVPILFWLSATIASTLLAAGLFSWRHLRDWGANGREVKRI